MHRSSTITFSLLLSTMLIIAASLQAVHASLEHDDEHHHEPCHLCIVAQSVDEAPVPAEFSLMLTLWQAKPDFVQHYFLAGQTPWFRDSRGPPAR